MRERITFIHGAEDAFDPSQLRLDNDTLYVNSLKAVREDRVTFSPHELPQEVWDSKDIAMAWLIVDLATASFQAMLRAPSEMGLVSNLYIHIAFCLQSIPRSARLLYTITKSSCVCKAMLETFIWV